MYDGNFRAQWIEALITARLKPDAMALGFLMCWRVGPHRDWIKRANADFLREIAFGKVDRLNAAKKALSDVGLVHITRRAGTGEWNTYTLVVPNENALTIPKSAFPENATPAKSGNPKSGNAAFPKKGNTAIPDPGNAIPYSLHPYSLHPNKVGSAFVDAGVQRTPFGLTAGVSIEIGGDRVIVEHSLSLDEIRRMSSDVDLSEDDRVEVAHAILWQWVAGGVGGGSDWKAQFAREYRDRLSFAFRVPLATRLTLTCPVLPPPTNSIGSRFSATSDDWRPPDGHCG